MSRVDELRGRLAKLLERTHGRGARPAFMREGYPAAIRGYLALLDALEMHEAEPLDGDGLDSEPSLLDYGKHRLATALLAIIEQAVGGIGGAT